jgi:hypothetical protein
MSIRRAFQIATFVLALAFSIGASGLTADAGRIPFPGCDPSTSGGFC